MKVTYEFEPDDMDKNDKFELQMCQNAHHMYAALSDIREYIRQLNKGWIEDDSEKMIDVISEYIYESKVGEIE